MLCAAITIAAAALGAGCKSTTSPSDGCTVITGNTMTTFSALGGSSSISVSTSASCTWGATSNAEFITINEGSSGSGNGTIVFSVAPNLGPQRTGSVTVTDTNDAFPDTVITITQLAP